MDSTRTGRIVLAVLALAAVVRVWGLDFGLPLPHARPDEVAIAGPALKCLLGNCRPETFYYPSLFIYAVAALYGAYFVVVAPLGWYPDLQAFAASSQGDLAPFLLIVRGVSALMGTLTVYWVYQLGTRAAGRAVGLVAGGFLALGFLHVRDSHFATSDVTMTGLVVLGVLRVLAWHDAPSRRNAALAGAVVGLAASVKYNALGVAVAFVVAAACLVSDAGPAGRARALRQVAVAAGVFGLLLLVAFLGTTPYVVLDWPRFVRDVFERGEDLGTSHSVILPRGWWHHPVVSLPAAFGWPVYVCALAGAVGWMATSLRRAAMVLAFPVAYFVVAGSMLTVFARYVLPIVPFLALTAAWLVVTLSRWMLPTARAQARGLATAAVAGLLILPSARDVWHLDRAMSRDDTRVVAARSLARVARPGQRVHRSGGMSGRVPFDLHGLRVDLDDVGFDLAHRSFTYADGTAAPDPDWLVVQRSPLVVYSDVPLELDVVAATRYRLIETIKATDERDGRVYDQQDAFFCPLSGLDGVKRLGPNVFLYQRRTDVAAAATPVP